MRLGKPFAAAAVACVGPHGDGSDSRPRAPTTRKAVAELWTRPYQAAVERNDAEAMARILLDDFVLVVGNGTVYTKADLLQSARAKEFVWEHQVEDPGTQKVRVWGDTAVGDGQALAERHERRQADRQEALVQRHLRSHEERVALCVRPGFAGSAAGSVTLAA